MGQFGKFMGSADNPSNWPEAVALLSAMGWAGDSILVRKGARASSVFAAAFVSYTVSALCFWAYVSTYFSFDLIRSPATPYFFLSGCLQPLLARILFYMGIVRLGVSRASPLRGTSPLFALLLAVIFLRERPALWVYGGTALIVGSVWVLSWRSRVEAPWRLFDIVFPLGAALVGAVSQNLRRAGLLIFPDPYFGAAVSTTTSLLLYVITLLSLRKIHLLRVQRESLPFFGCAAFVSALAQMLNYIALSLGEVSVMVPLLDTTPLFSVFFSALFLRDQEKVTGRIVFGAVLTVAGVAIIAGR